MPELPDVEVFRRYLARHARRQTIEKTQVSCPEMLESTNAGGLGRQMKGRQISEGHRHGKYLFAELDDGTALVLHFGMTGYLVYGKPDQGPPDYACLTLHFQNNRNLYYISKRKLGTITHTPDRKAYVQEKGLGPDARSIDADSFVAILQAGRGAIKARLMDQSRLAGLGNVYSDEVLFQAGLHPRTPVEKLDADSLRRLYRTMCEVIDTAIKAGAQPERMPAAFLLPQREEGASCPHCGGKVKKFKVSGRSGYLCPQCQPAPG